MKRNVKTLDIKRCMDEFPWNREEKGMLMENWELLTTLDYVIFRVPHSDYYDQNIGYLVSELRKHKVQRAAWCVDPNNEVGLFLFMSEKQPQGFSNDGSQLTSCRFLGIWSLYLQTSK